MPRAVASGVSVKKEGRVPKVFRSCIVTMFVFGTYGFDPMRHGP